MAAAPRKGKRSNPILVDWVAANRETIAADNGCDFDADDLGVFARSGVADPISAICRIVSAEIGLKLSGETIPPTKDPHGWTLDNGRKFYGLSEVREYQRQDSVPEPEAVIPDPEAV